MGGCTTRSSAQLVCQLLPMAHFWCGKEETRLLALNFWLCLGPPRRGGGPGPCQLAGGNCEVLLVYPMLSACG